MKNKLLTLTALGLCSHQLYPMGSISKSANPEFSVSSSVAELKGAAESAKENHEALIKKITNFTNLIMKKAIDSSNNLIESLDGDKAAGIEGQKTRLSKLVEELNESTTATDALAKTVKVLEQVKSIGILFNSLSADFLDDVYTTLATTPLFSAQQKIDIKTAIENIKENIDLARQAFPKAMRRTSSVKSVLKEAGSEFVKIGLQSGFDAAGEGLKTLINSLLGKPSPAEEQAAKEKLVAAIKTYLRVNEQIKDIFEEAGTNIISNLKRIEKINPQFVEDIKEAFKAAASPESNIAKFEVYTKGSSAMVKLVQLFDDKLRALVTGIQSFSLIVIGEDAASENDKYLELNAMVSKIEKSLLDLKKVLGTVPAAVESAKEKFSKSSIPLPPGPSFPDSSSTFNKPSPTPAPNPPLPGRKTYYQ